MSRPYNTDALAELAPGNLLNIASKALVVAVAPEAGGRIAQIEYHGQEWLVGYSREHAAMIGWGSYPMLPWAGRIRHGRFEFAGRLHQLPPNFGGHAIHGVGFAMPWRVDAHSPAHVELSLALPDDERWPFGGSARQRITVAEHSLRMQLQVTAGEKRMPAVIGWHPWLRKPDRIEFRPSRVYPRDAEGIATCPLAEPPPPPWDDCFLNGEPVILERSSQRLRLSSNCDHWVVYDEPAYATCIEPQSGPADAFNLHPTRYLEPGTTVTAWFLWEWL
jgi:aldose 1-epimerase